MKGYRLERLERHPCRLLASDRQGTSLMWERYYNTLPSDVERDIAMADDDLQARIDKLPIWARQYIRQLLIKAEPAIDEVRQIRSKLAAAEDKIRRLSDRLTAILELFNRAGATGLDWAKTVHETLAVYGIDKPPS